MQASNYLGTERTGKLLLKFAVPCIFSLIISCLYNIVDQIFVGNGVGYLGNAATGVIFPITVIGWGVSLFFGDGAAASLSVSLGKNETEQLVLHPQPLKLCGFALMRRLTVPAGAALGLLLYSCRLLSLPDTASLQTFFDLTALQPRMFCDFPVCFSCLLHWHDFRLQFLYLGVFSFLHNTTSLCSLFSYTGGLLSIVRFYWAGSIGSPPVLFYRTSSCFSFA